jgi:hypothetical protein
MCNALDVFKFTVKVCASQFVEKCQRKGSILVILARDNTPSDANEGIIVGADATPSLYIRPPVLAWRMPTSPKPFLSVNIVTSFFTHSPSWIALGSYRRALVSIPGHSM